MVVVWCRYVSDLFYCSIKDKGYRFLRPILVLVNVKILQNTFVPF